MDDSTVAPWGLSWSVPASSSSPGAPSEKAPAGAHAEPPPPERKKRAGVWKFFFLVLGATAGYGLWDLQQAEVQASTPVSRVRTIVASPGVLERSLRVGGTVEAKKSASIRAPQMRGPRDAGKSSLTLMKLAKPGSIIPAGGVVAEFELKWLEDHIDDTTSSVVQSKANVRKLEAEIMITRETDAQQLRTAEAEREKAKLDLRTAEVRSQIEAQILELAVKENSATTNQLSEEVKTKEAAHAADIRVREIEAEEQGLHLLRHERDFEKLKIHSPVPGLIVMETNYKGGGSFAQTEEGDQVYPGSLFMRVVDLSEMIVNAQLNQTDVQLIHIGQTATVRFDAYPNLVLEGRVVRVGAMATSGEGGFGPRGGASATYVKTIPVEIAIKGADKRVIPDLSASADIQLQANDVEILLPREAVRQEGDRYVVYVKNGPKFVAREVELGQMSDTHIAVLKGIASGDEVALGAVRSD